MKILSREGLEKAFDTYCNNGVLYDTLVGFKGRQISEEDKQEQKKFVDMFMRTDPNGYSEYGTPESTFNNPAEAFCHVVSRDFNIEEAKHRLYFNFEDHKKELQFASEYINMCKSVEKIPFYLKFHKTIERDDGFAIYVEDQHLPEVLRILDSLAYQNPEYTKTGDLPLAAYNCGWYGYGKELSDHSSSFSKKVEMTVKDVVADMLYESGYAVTDEVFNPDGSSYLRYNQDKLLNSAKTLQANLTPENSGDFYRYFSGKLADELRAKELLLDETSVPACILQREREL